MNGQSKISYSFGSYVLEVSERRLWKDKAIIALTPKAFETLVVLVSNKGRVVEKDVLLDRVWADTFVEEGTLAQNILTLRKALGMLDDGRQFIETVPRTGYRFIADVKEIVSDDEIVILEHRVKTEITAEQKTVPDEEAIAVRQSQPFVSSLTKNKTLTLGLVLTSVLVLVGTALSIRYAFQPEKFSSTKFNKIEVSKLTSEGDVSRATISPDGKYLAFVKNQQGEQSIFTKQITGTEAFEVLPSKNQRIVGLTFSPDGSQLYYTGYENVSATTPAIGHLYRISMLGGTPREILADIDSPADISPDGKQIAFIRYSPQEQTSSLIVTDIEGKDEKKIATRQTSKDFSSLGLSWSPDGKIIACGSYVTGEVGKQMEILLVDTANGEQKSLSKENWLWIGQIDWLKDGSGVIFPGWNSRSGNSTDEIWMLSIDGTARQISSGINGVFSLSVTADSNSIAAIKSDRITDFWIASAPDFKQPVKLLQNHAEFHMSPPGIATLASDKVIFGSTFNSNLDIWAINSDGKGQQQLTTNEAADYYPIATSDGKTIIFISNRSGRENLWKMNADGNKQEQLTDEINVSSPTISPDNKFVYYSSLDETAGKYFLRKIDLETREVVQITSQPTTHPRLSPDGNFLACYFPESPSQERRLKLTILSTQNYEVVKQFNPPFNQGRLSAIEWKDNQTLSYLTSSKGDTKIWEHPINGEASVLLDFPQTSVFRFAWSADGKNLIYEKGMTLNNSILINSVK